MRIQPGWFDAFFILRPTLFFPAWTVFLAGYAKGYGTGSGIVWHLVWLASALGAAFLLNQLSDRKEDSLNDKLLPLWGERVSLRMIRIELGILTAITLIGGVLAGWESFGLLILFFLIAGVFYNVTPFRLKDRPILGIVSSACGGWILFLMGGRTAGVETGSTVWFGLPYVLAGAGASLLTHVPDLDGDKRLGLHTFPAVFGLTKTGIWSVTLVLAAVVLAVFPGDYILLIAAVISLPFYIRFLTTPASETAELAVKISIFSLAVMVGTTWIPFLLMMALYYFFARWYHRSRLGLDYPTFRSRSSIASLSFSRTDMEKAEVA